MVRVTRTLPANIGGRVINTPGQGGRLSPGVLLQGQLGVADCNHPALFQVAK